MKNMKDKLARKAVLVYPKFPDNTFWGFNESLKKYLPLNEFGLPKRTLPPLGLMGLFNYLKPFYDNLVLLDRNVNSTPLGEVIKDANHVYLGGMIAQEKDMIEDAKLIKSKNKTLIVGGTIVDEDSPLFNIADHLVENEAEMVIDDLIEGLYNKNAKKYYKGFPADPEKFFRPDFSSINLNHYTNMAIQISRGCPHACEFCDITARFGTEPRITPKKYTEQSLKQLFNLGSRKPIFVVDDNFIGNPIQTIETLKNIYGAEKKLGYHFPKFTELTMSLSDNSDLMKKLRYWLKETNFTMQFIGVETNNIQALKETGKYQNLRGTKSLEEKLSFISEETGGGITTGMIYGFDNDISPDSLIDFINATNSPTVMVGLLSALPHTKLWSRLKKEGRLMDKTTGNNSDGVLNFIPYNFSAKQAEKDYLRILEEIYDKDKFFTRVMKELSLVNPRKTHNVNNAKEALKSVFKILTKNNAFAFWEYLPEAHKIAKERFGFNTEDYRNLMSEYFVNCTKYTHFRSQVDYLKKQMKNRQYKPWQLYSWKELQNSIVDKVNLIEPAKIALNDTIKMQLQNGYEFVGTRIEALSHFIEPYLKEGLRELKTLKEVKPSLEHFINVELDAYFKAHTKRPEILGGLNKFNEVKEHLQTYLQNQMNEFTGMQAIFNKV